MPLVEAAASAGHRNAMEGNGWSAMVPSQGSSQSTRQTLKILALDQSDSGWQWIKEKSCLRCGIRSDQAHVGGAPAQFPDPPRNSISRRRKCLPPRPNERVFIGSGLAGLGPRRGTTTGNFGTAATRREL